MDNRKKRQSFGSQNVISWKIKSLGLFGTIYYALTIYYHSACCPSFVPVGYRYSSLGISTQITLSMCSGIGELSDKNHALESAVYIVLIAELWAEFSFGYALELTDIIILYCSILLYTAQHGIYEFYHTSTGAHGFERKRGCQLEVF